MASSLERLSVSDGNSKDAVWELLGRHSKVGKQLFNLYYGGDSRATDVGNLFSDNNRAAHLRRLAAGHSPPKPAAKAKPVPKSRAYVEVPSPSKQAPASPGLQRPQGKKSLESIQKDTQQFDFPPLEPKGPLLDEVEKERLALLNQFRGQLPRGLTELLEQRQSRGGGAQQQQGGMQTQQQLLTMFTKLSEEIQRKQQAVRGGGSGAEADKLRREIKQDLKHLQQLDATLAKLESL